MDSSTLMSMAADNPQAEAAEGNLKDGNWWPDSIMHDINNLNNIHAANATCAAIQADVAAKHAASLAQWVQYLWGQIASLQNKVVELEDWKTKTLDDMSKLRFEHKQLRRKVMPEDQADEAALPKAISLPLLLADHVDANDTRSSSKKGKAASASHSAASSPSAGMRPPPGLELLLEPNKALADLSAAKQVRFAEEAPPTPGTGSEDLLASTHTMSLASVTSVLSEAESSASASMDESPLEGVTVTPTVADGVESQCAEWRIGHLSTKLRGCMGRALVSSPFTAWGLEDLRLMVFPDGKEVAKGPRSRRQKELYAKKVSEGPLEGCLKLKVADCPAPHILEYYLKVGSIRKGIFRHNFADSTVNGCSDFGIDWLKQVDADQSLTVTVEILKLPTSVDSPAQGAGDGSTVAAVSVSAEVDSQQAVDEQTVPSELSQ